MDAISRRLLFRIGKVGFCLDLNELVEILEQAATLIDYEKADPQSFVVGALAFRRTMIPVIDLASRLGLASEQTDTVLVLNSYEGNWALSVDKIEGFYPADELVDKPVPRLMQSDGWQCFSQIALMNGAPFARLDLSACYAGGR